MFKKSLLGIAMVTVLALGTTGCTSGNRVKTADPEPVTQETEMPEEKTGGEEAAEDPEGNPGEQEVHGDPEENSGEQEAAADPEENTPVQTISAIEPEGTVGGFNYSVTENAGYWRESKMPGYYIDSLDEPNAPFFFFITCGEKNTGGYGVVVTDITVDEDENMEITVCFTEPEPDAVVTMALEYPMTQVTVDRLPASITIKTVDGTELEELE
ncbi:MAG: protease complex subunit PrcB family protein [Lachnospiraceae bacterium]|nr:protease complex subunit PrcB family protein [Lachnospiraceae bacterium]